jgi:alkylation response protein AidB-like acyl-CoA dehydrogenase
MSTLTADTTVAGTDPRDRGATMVAAVRDIARTELAPIVSAIDLEGLYPERILRAFGAAGAYASHLPDPATGRADLWPAIEAMSATSEHCLSTGFCMWCQDALAWYIATSDNESLKGSLGQGVASGETLGGTGLSNPMKALFGIERFKLKGRRVEGGYLVRGALPWVSNLQSDHVFGTIFEREDDPEHRIMTVVHCNAPGVRLVQTAQFTALDGTRTFSVQLRDTFVPDAHVLADPIATYLPRIRAGFILLQAGMGLGLIRNCIDIMRAERASLGHINGYLERQPEDFTRSLASLEGEVRLLAGTPFEPDDEYFRRVMEARLAISELSVQAAHFAMLHQGAKGYVSTGAAQRRLREAYFVAIVTPATKQLRKMLAECPQSDTRGRVARPASDDTS